MATLTDELETETAALGAELPGDPGRRRGGHRGRGAARAAGEI